MNDPILVRGCSTRMVDEKPVTIDYAYMANQATLTEGQLIAWAERRAAEQKRGII